MDPDAVAIELMEGGEGGGTHADNVRNFVQDVCEHIEKSFGLVPGEPVSWKHLYFDMIRPEGTEYWWLDYMHPYSVMMQTNGMEPVAQIDGSRKGLGRVFVFSDEAIEQTVSTVWNWMRAEGKIATEEQDKT